MRLPLNPWPELPGEPPYLLPADRGAVSRFNKSLAEKGNTLHQLVPTSLPEPYSGDPRTARVVLLGLNPGHDDSDTWWFNEHPECVEVVLANLLHEPREYPFYHLNPALKGFGGYQWWHKRLRRLREVCGQKLVSQRLAVIEWYPYHSRKFHGKAPRSAGQLYSWELARTALEDPDRVVVVMRGRRLWEHTLGSLATAMVLRNPQQTYLSEGNLPPDGFKRLCEAILR